jgi:hypothetical protein
VERAHRRNKAERLTCVAQRAAGGLHITCFRDDLHGERSEILAHHGELAVVQFIESETLFFGEVVAFRV